MPLFFRLLSLLAGRRTGDEVDVVDDRLHPGAEFLLKRARQVADVFAEGDRWARHQQAGVVMGIGHLVQTSSDGQQRFARAGLVSFLGGFSALLGIAGGTITVITMSICKRPIYQAVATASGVGLIIGLVGALGFLG